MPSFGRQAEPLPEQPSEGAQPAPGEVATADAETTAEAMETAEHAATTPDPAPGQVAGAVDESGAHAAEQAALAAAAAELDEVEAALGRLEDGSFDSCQVCGAPIGRDRLQRDPLLTRCPQHANAAPAAGGAPAGPPAG